MRIERDSRRREVEAALMAAEVKVVDAGHEGTVQVVIEVAFGSALSLLPGRVVAAFVALLFAVGAFLLLREGFGDTEDDDDSAVAERNQLPFWRISLTRLESLFAAERGGASQLAVVALAARYRDPLAVALGAWLALALVATRAGTKPAHRLPVHLIQRAAGVIRAEGRVPRGVSMTGAPRGAPPPLVAHVELLVG